MTPSDSRNPAVNSRSAPGVRIITENGLPCSRTSRGSSVAARSSTGLPSPRLMRVTCTRRNGEKESDMIAEHQLARMRLKISLAGEIGDTVQPDMMRQECNGHDERQEASPILIDAVRKFLAGCRVEPLLEMSGHMHQHVGMPTRIRRCGQRCHEQLLVLCAHFAARHLFRAGDESPNFLIARGGMREQRHLV